MSTLLWVVVVILVLASLYVIRNDAVLLSLPHRAAAFSPHRCQPKDVHALADQLRRTPRSVSDQIPPATGRRYIVVGGAGFLGGWIVVQLLERGEDPRKIRVIDIRPPIRKDLTTGLAKYVQFVQTDITDALAVETAFKAPWPVTSTLESEPELTVFNAAANIRFFERHLSLLPYSAKVNVEGTRNVVNAARSAGASILIYTSSGSISVHSSRFWLWPWESEPKRFVQLIDDNDDLIPKRHSDFFSNYAVSKWQGEKVSREADRSSSNSRSGILRTGCIRPGCGVYGPGGDLSTTIYFKNRRTQSWISGILQSWVYVENCAVSHLLYEQRLIETSRGGSNPDIGGQAFCVTDPGPPAAYGDMQTTITTLTNGEVTFPPISPTLVLSIAHIVEMYDLTRHFLLSHVPRIGSMLPYGGVIMKMQPAMFALTGVHVICDDSRARLPPHKGGLGYKGSWTTLEGYQTTIKADFISRKKAEKSIKVEVGNVSAVFDVGLVSAKTVTFDSTRKMELPN